MTDIGEARAVAELTVTQKEAIIVCVDLLSWMADEGMGAETPDGIRFADDAIFELFNAFAPDWAGDTEYPESVREILLSEGGEG